MNTKYYTYALSLASTAVLGISSMASAQSTESETPAAAAPATEQQPPAETKTETADSKPQEATSSSSENVDAKPRQQSGPDRFLSRIPLYTALDINKDGEITADELEKASDSLKALDKNQDGKLSADELRPAFNEGGFGGQRGERGNRGGYGEKRGKGKGKDKHKHDKGDMGGHDDQGGESKKDRKKDRQNEGGYGRGNEGGNAAAPAAATAPAAPSGMVTRLMAYDKNKDGKLSKDEVPERMAQILTKADKDGDGVATEAELIAAYSTPASTSASVNDQGGGKGKNNMQDTGADYGGGDDDDDDDDN